MKNILRLFAVALCLIASPAFATDTPQGLVSCGSNNYSANVVNVKCHGATGNGTTDDTAAIQAAINAAATVAVPNKGQEVYLPSGIYIVTGLTLPSFVTLAGAGWGITVIQLKARTAADVITVPTGSNLFGIRDMTIDGNSANGSTGNGITFAITGALSGGNGNYANKTPLSASSYKTAVIQNVIVQNASNNCFNYNAYSYASFSTNVYALQCGNYGFYMASTDSILTNFYAEYNLVAGVYVAGSNNKVSFGKSIFTGTLGAGIAGVYVTGFRNTITGVEAQDNYTNGFVDFSTSGDNQFIGCLSDSNGYAANNTNASSKTAAGFILGGGGIYIGDKVTDYRGRLGDGNYTTEWPYIIPFGYHPSQVDITYDQTNSGPLANATSSVYSLGPNVSVAQSGFVGIGVASPTHALELSSANQAYFAGGAFVSGLSLLNYSGGSNTAFVTGLTAPRSIAFAAGGNLYVTSPGSNTVSKCTSLGVCSNFGSGFSNPYGIAVDTSGNVFVTNATPGTVSKCTSGGSCTTFASGFSSAIGVATDAAGNVYIANSSPGTVTKCTSRGSCAILISEGIANPQGITLDPTGNIYLSIGGSLLKCQASGTYCVVWAASGFSGPAGLILDSTGNLYVANSGNGNVLKCTAAGSCSTFAVRFSAPTGVAFDGSGNLYVTNAGGTTVSKVVTPTSIASAPAIISTAPTFTSGACTGAMGAANTTAAFTITTGTGNCSSTMTIAMPAANTGWICDAFDEAVAGTARIQETSDTTTSVVLTNYSIGTSPAPANFTASHTVKVKCMAY